MTTEYEHFSDAELQGKARDHRDQAANYEKLLREREQFRAWKPTAEAFAKLICEIEQKLHRESRVMRYFDAQSAEALRNQPGFTQLIGLLSYCYNISISIEDADVEPGVAPKVRVIGVNAPVLPQQASWLHALAEEHAPRA